jgi:hypothetical protein
MRVAAERRGGGGYPDRDQRKREALRGDIFHTGSLSWLPGFLMISGRLLVASGYFP